MSVAMPLMVAVDSKVSERLYCRDYTIGFSENGPMLPSKEGPNEHFIEPFRFCFVKEIRLDRLWVLCYERVDITLWKFLRPVGFSGVIAITMP